MNTRKRREKNRRNRRNRRRRLTRIVRIMIRQKIGAQFGLWPFAPMQVLTFEFTF